MRICRYFDRVIPGYYARFGVAVPGFLRQVMQDVSCLFCLIPPCVCVRGACALRSHIDLCVERLRRQSPEEEERRGTKR